MANTQQINNIPRSIKARVVCKYGSKEDWEKATEFIPLRGEPIFISNGSSHGNLAYVVGDGKTKINNLHRISTEVEELSNFDVINQNNSITASENVAAFGQENVVGQHAFAIVIPQDENGKTIIPQDWIDGKYYILDSVKDLEIGQTFSIRLTEHRYNYGAITAIDVNLNKVTVDKFYNDTSIENKPFFWILEKPEVGTTDIGATAFTTGIENKAQGLCSISLGRLNNSYGWYSATIGLQNSAGYAACALGKANQAHGTGSIAGGDNNEVLGYVSAAFGARNKILGAGSFSTGVDNEIQSGGRVAATLGEGLIAKAEGQVVVGRFNAERSGSIFIVGTGTAKDGSKRKTSFEVLMNGETRVHTKLALRDNNNTKDIAWMSEGKIWAETKIACAGLIEANSLKVITSISENGKLLSEKYATKEDLEAIDTDTNSYHTAGSWGIDKNKFTYTLKGKGTDDITITLPMEDILSYITEKLPEWTGGSY